MTQLFRKKNIFFPVSISLLIVFLFVSMNPDILIQGFRYNRNTIEGETKATDNMDSTKNVCSLATRSCCCDVSDHTRNDCCCCKSKTLGNNVTALSTTSDNNFLSAVISTIKCANIPGNISVSSLADYEPILLNRFSYLLEESGRIYKRLKNNIAEPHLSLQFKPPKIAV